MHSMRVVFEALLPGALAIFSLHLPLDASGTMAFGVEVVGTGEGRYKVVLALAAGQVEAPLGSSAGKGTRSRNETNCCAYCTEGNRTTVTALRSYSGLH